MVVRSFSGMSFLRTRLGIPFRTASRSSGLKPPSGGMSYCSTYSVPASSSARGFVFVHMLLFPVRKLFNDWKKWPFPSEQNISTSCDLRCRCIDGFGNPAPVSSTIPIQFLIASRPSSLLCDFSRTRTGMSYPEWSFCSCSSTVLFRNPLAIDCETLCTCSTLSPVCPRFEKSGITSRQFTVTRSVDSAYFVNRSRSVVTSFATISPKGSIVFPSHWGL
mmetsp:Transcript_8855/g.21558  ORF Transcript_8855/g.21558 Transcript_8855/m.21558 type:complete len:219 (+) Transcript_8855:845-1501(+)